MFRSLSDSALRMLGALAFARQPRPRTTPTPGGVEHKKVARQIGIPESRIGALADELDEAGCLNIQTFGRADVTAKGIEVAEAALASGEITEANITAST